MIDLSLTKLALIGVVALVVIGPEKLPKIARMAGTLFGRAQRYINDVKSEVSREMAFDDLHDIKKEAYAAAQEIKQGMAIFHSADTDEISAQQTSEEVLLHANFSAKAREFRRNRRNLASTQRTGGRTGIASVASRIARYGTHRTAAKSFWQ